MAVPVDSNAGVRETFVTAVESDVVVHLSFVIFRILLGAAHSGLFVCSEQKDEVAPGCYFCRVERPNRGEQGFDVSRVVANAGSVDATIANSGFDLEPRLKHSVHVSIKHRNWTTTGSFPRRDQIAR